VIFTEAKLRGVFVIDPERHEDERGYFARTWCRREFAEHGLSTDLAQCSVSFNKRKGTLRGIHYQAVPHEEAKLVRCTRGAVYDVVLDLRPDSPTFTQWIAAELSAANGRMLYIPEGYAHGFQTMTDDTEVFYQIAEFYHAELTRGVRWNDPAFAVRWPFPPVVMSARDQSYPDFARPQPGRVTAGASVGSEQS
jgi:dTDP-4-dehydrorhamnose 3,5-epimerase